MSLTLWNNCQKAASYYDKEAPGWWKQVDLNEFDMSRVSKCLLGQCTSSAIGSIVSLDITIKNEDVLAVWHRQEDHIKKLQRYWTTLITQRRENPKKYV